MALDPGVASFLMLGLLVGMGHALEADHVAAVASLATRSGSLAATVRIGTVWGLGHAIVLAAVAGALAVAGASLPARLASLLEAGVGAMLVLLGADVLRRLVVERIHFHRHAHDGHVHFHAHSHAHERGPHDPARHHHVHPRGLPLRALLVGMTHGMAGSAALVVLAAGHAGAGWTALGYVALFGAGSIAGMALLSLAIAWPLTRWAGALTFARNGVHGLIGAVTLSLGIAILAENAGVLTR